MLLSKAKQLVEHIFAAPLISELAIKGDKLSSHQTDHGMTHFLEVVKIARLLSQRLLTEKPGMLSDWETEIIIPLAALLHDIGRAINVDDHAAAGAKWSRDFLLSATLNGDTETLPRKSINRICKIIACHRSNVVLNREFDDNCWAVVVLADKFAGDEERVRPGRALALAILTHFGLPFIPLRKGGIHDRVNFAIKDARPLLSKEDLVLHLTIDPRVCDSKLIVDTYADRYLACHRAAKHLGLRFQIKVLSTHSYGPFNRLRSMLGCSKPQVLHSYAYNETSKDWQLWS